MKLPNPLHPNLMKPLERRAELCRILALGLIRLHQRADMQLIAETGESSLHILPDESGSPDAKHRRNA